MSRLYTWIGTFSIRTKYISAFLIVSMLSITIVTAFTMGVARDRLTTQIGTMLHRNAVAEGQVIGDMLVRQVDQLVTFSLGTAMVEPLKDSNADYPADTQAIRARLTNLDTRWINADDKDSLITGRLVNLVAARLRDYQAALPQHIEVFVTDRYGGLVATTQRTTDFYQADEAWWQAAWNNGKGGVYLGQPALDESSQTFAMVLAVPVRDGKTGEIVGILRSTYRLNDLVRSIEAARWGETGRARVLLPDGQYLTNGEQAAVEPEVLQRIPETGAANLTYEAAQRFISRAPVAATTSEGVVERLGWTVLLYQDQRESLTPVTGTIRTSVVAALLALFLSSLIALMMAQRTSRPLTLLTDAVERFAGGNFSHRVELQRGDELGALAQRFNAMAALIEAQTQGLHAEIVRADTARAEADAARTRIAAQLDTIEQQHTLIREMSVPVLPLSSDTLVMPLIGTLDQQRMLHVQEQALHALEYSSARYLIVDVTGVPVIDTAVAQGLLQVVQAARLLGAQALLAGMRPDVAQTLVGLGVDLSSIATRSSLQSAITGLLHQST